MVAANKGKGKMVGIGGFSEVYLANDTKTGKKVALKQTNSRMNIKKLSTEMACLLDLRGSKYIVQLLDYHCRTMVITFHAA